MPLAERKEQLAALVGDGHGRIRYSDHIVGNGEKLFSSFCDAGLEGLISKQAEARYSGLRSCNWNETKCIGRQEFIVGGCTASDKERGFHSLLFGVNENGKLRYAGKAGAGFSGDEIERLMELVPRLERTEPTVEAPRCGSRCPPDRAEAGRRDRPYRVHRRAGPAPSELSKAARGQETRSGRSGSRGACGNRHRPRVSKRADRQPGARDLS